MKIAKNYYHDKSVLLLLAVNAGLLVLVLATVLLNVDTEASTTSIVSYRASRSIQVSGPTGDLYDFALFGVIATTVATLLSIKLYNLRRHLAVTMLSLNVIVLALSLVVFNALTRTI